MVWLQDEKVKIIMIKDVLDKTSAHYIYQQLLDSNFPWFFLSNSALGGSKDDLTYSWFHLLYDKKVPNSKWYPIFELSIKKIIEFTLSLSVRKLKSMIQIYSMPYFGHFTYFRFFRSMRFKKVCYYVLCGYFFKVESSTKNILE